MTLLEQHQTACPAHTETFQKLKEALAEVQARPGGSNEAWEARNTLRGLRSTIHLLWQDCRDCQAATLAAARQYAAEAGQRARLKQNHQPRCRRCGPYGTKTPHTHNAEGGFVFCIPGPPVPMGYPPKGSEWATWLAGIGKEAASGVAPA